MASRTRLTRAERIVVKVGTRVVLHPDGHVNGEVLMPLCRQIIELRRQDRQVILVSSGAVGLGRAILGARGDETLTQRGAQPRDVSLTQRGSQTRDVSLTQRGSQTRDVSLALKQALAALGQAELMNVWRRIFELLNVPVAQVLLTREDLNARERYLNARNTLNSLLRVGAIPVINENDSVSTDEIRFGDNDILASLVGGLMDADLVINLTQAAGLLDSEGRVVSSVERIDEDLYALVDPSLSTGGTGGMASKLEAARAALGYGAAMVIAAAREPDVLLRILAGEELGTMFAASGRRLSGKKRWLAAAKACRGRLRIDSGAVRALAKLGKSLLAVGVIEVEGDFRIGDLVAILDRDGHEVGRGLSNLPSEELRGLQGAGGGGKRSSPEVIHRDNLVIHHGKEETRPC